MPVKRNATGQQNIKDLRRELAARDDVTVRPQGGNWIISKLVENCWHESTCPYWYTERQAIQKALFGEPEMADEEVYHANKSSR